MTRLITIITIFFLSIPGITYGKENTTKIAIIKADDVTRITKNWQRFFDISKEKEVKVSAGIICNSLSRGRKEYLDWLNSLNSSGQVEFWNHGWDHKRWTTDGATVREFAGSGYKHQKNHFNDSQKIMKRIFGSTPIAFGTPYNKVDEDTVRVLNEDSDMRLFFCYSPKGLQNKILAPMKFRGEHDGTGKPNFTKFKADYLKKKGVTFSAIQFHPNNFKEEHFEEYLKIIDFLISEGWIFMLPSEYVFKVDKSVQEKNKI